MMKPMSIAETSRILGISIPTVWKQLEAGHLSSLIINGTRQVILPQTKVLTLPLARTQGSYLRLCNAAHEAPPDVAA